MFFHTLEIKEFRCFVDKTLRLGKFVAVLSGRNTTGKSTILGMLGNSTEMKKNVGQTYFSRQFRAEFSELFKGSKDHDPIGSDKFRISLADNTETPVESRQFRVAWQTPKNGPKKNTKPELKQTQQQSESKNDDPRKQFRVIPTHKDTNGKKRETKFDLPVYYLGLSRLFPIGEADGDNLRSAIIPFINEEHEEWFINTYKKVLYLNEESQTISGISIGETDNKRAVGVNTSTYDYLTNSAGQDNVGQILMALLSFKQIRFSISAWKGGLLLIDEFDATLLPSAQNELFDIIFRTAKELGIQVAFTTHSISPLQHICTKIGHNADDRNNDIEFYCFTKKNRRLEIERNSSIYDIKGDLTVKSLIKGGRQILLYAEDDEARWFFNNLARSYLGRLSIPNVSLGSNELLHLLEADIQYFGNALILFDGDVSDDVINSSKIANRPKNIIRLPGNARPEQVISDYILSLPSDHPFWEECKVMQFSWEYFNINKPDSEKYQGRKRVKYYHGTKF